jgi:hypothetical protein
MGLGHGVVEHTAEGVAYIDSPYNEYGQLWIWRAWADWMNADNWNSLKSDRCAAPSGKM